jgi:phospholipid/cholesterol/gamma-HCH transport system substrate-binding protein
MSRLFKIGLFVILTATGTIMYMLRTADRIESKSTYMVEAYMDDASGLLVNTHVRMAGVTVGKVHSVELVKGKAKLVLELSTDVKLYEDARVEKKLDSMLGSSSVAIFPGVREEIPLHAGGTIRNTISADAMTQTLTGVGVIAEEATGLIKDLRQFLNEDGGFAALMDILESTRAALEDMSAITKQIRGTSREELAPLAAILRNTASITEKLDLILINNNENINETLSGIKESITKLNVALDQIAGITTKINEGEGNLGKLVNDDELYDKVVDIAGGLENFFSSTMGIDLQIAFQTDYLMKQKESRSQFGVRLTPGDKDKFYALGLVDTPRLDEKIVTTHTVVTGASPPTTPPFGTDYTTTETERRRKLLINAQIARRFGMFTLRGGAIESTGGVGVDFQPHGKFSISTELFDFSQEKAPYLRAYGSIYPFFDPALSNPLNWIYIAGGVDNILTENRDYFMSLGLRFTDNDLKGIASIGGGLTSIAQ